MTSRTESEESSAGEKYPRSKNLSYKSSTYDNTVPIDGKSDERRHKGRPPIELALDSFPVEPECDGGKQELGDEGENGQCYFAVIL